MTLAILTIKIIRKLYRILFVQDGKQTKQYQKYVRLYNQEANDYIRDLLSTNKPIMVSKFGTNELATIEEFRSVHQETYTFKDILSYILCKRNFLWWNEGLGGICDNAGFFPKDYSLIPQFYDINVQSVKQIDVLGSYLYSECFFNEELKNAVRVNLDGYYAPFLFKNPWTKILKGKRVLVIHPFAAEIGNQYKKRALIWEDPNVLPDFTLITYKSVQSILGVETQFKNWFDALEKMEHDISSIDFDIALIGCGAYGMPIAAYVKKLGKQSIHLGGWVQILFGIIGKRWEDIPEVSKYFNEHWIHPYSNSIPKNAEKVEGGCYW
jgi:hypothetical protein